MKVSGRGVLSLLVGVAVLAVSSPHVLAAPGPSLTTSPVSIDLPVKPGTSANSTLTVMNNGVQPIPITMELDTFNAFGNGGEAAIKKLAPTDPMVSWVQFSPASFSAQPGVWTSVKMTVTLPKTADLGYYFAVVFKPSIAPPTKGSGINVFKSSNAILALIDTNSGNERRQLDIKNFSVSKIVYEYLPTTFKITVHNTGNIFLAPRGNVYISRQSNFTSALATLDFNPGHSNVLPNSSRDYQALWSDGFPVFQDKQIAGQTVTIKGKPVQQLRWDFTKLNNFRFGKYYAELALVYNNGTRDIPVTGVVSFWVIPWKLLLGLLVFVALLGLGLWSVGRSLTRRIQGVRKKKR